MSCWRSAAARWSVAAARSRCGSRWPALSRTVQWSLAGGLIANAVTFAICLPLLRRFRHVRMPLITRRWYDIPLRASLVATLVATVVTLSRWVGPSVSGMIALFPVVFTSMMLILHPRIGGRPTAAVIANGGWGLIGFGIAIAVLHVAALRFGSAIALSLALLDLRRLESRAVVERAAEAGALDSKPSLRGAKRRSNPLFLVGRMDRFAEPVIGRAFARPVGSQ